MKLLHEQLADVSLIHYLLWVLSLELLLSQLSALAVGSAAAVPAFSGLGP